MRAFAALLLVVASAGCATAPLGESGPRLLLAYDTGDPEAAINFPSLSYEALVRFELPEQGHSLSRLWIHAGSTGSLRWAVYESNALEGPGALLKEGNREIGPKDTAAGRDGPWVVEDLSTLGARAGVLWIGVKKVGGEPTVSACRRDSRNYFVRDEDPKTKIDLLPVRRAPLIRLELIPKR